MRHDLKEVCVEREGLEGGDLAKHEASCENCVQLFVTCLACGMTDMEGMTEDCPGSPIDDFTMRKVFLGRLDFRHGQWVRPAPAYFTKYGWSQENVMKALDEYHSGTSMMQEKVKRGW